MSTFRLTAGWILQCDQSSCGKTSTFLTFILTASRTLQIFPKIMWQSENILLQERVDMMSQRLLWGWTSCYMWQSVHLKARVDEKYLNGMYRCKNVTGANCHNRQVHWVDGQCGSHCSVVGSWVDGLSRHCCERCTLCIYSWTISTDANISDIVFFLLFKNLPRLLINSLKCVIFDRGDIPRFWKTVLCKMQKKELFSLIISQTPRSV